MSIDDQITQLVNEGKTRSEIASELGRNYYVICRHINRLGLTPVEGRGSAPNSLSKRTVGLRMQLGALILEMRENKSANEISQITGLNRRELRRAEVRPWDHDWTLSQIERTLDYHDIELKELV